MGEVMLVAARSAGLARNSPLFHRAAADSGLSLPLFMIQKTEKPQPG